MIQVIAITKENKTISGITIEQLKEMDYKWFWIDFNQPEEHEIRELDKALRFHPLAIEDCIHSLQRPKLDYYDSYTFYVTHAIMKEDLGRNEINFFIGKDYIVSFHHQDAKEVNAVWNRVLSLENLEKWDEYRCFYEILDKIVDNYFPIVYELEDALNEIEENDEEKPMDELLDRLFDIRHQLLALRHTINPVRDLLYRMLNSHHLSLVLDRREYFVDIYDHLLKLSEMVSSNREIANDIRDNYISINSHQQNQVIQVLTVITSIFAPLTFIAGIYGMNFQRMPELMWDYGYFIVLGLMGVIAVLMFIWFKRKGWF
ncbi:magnesium/cobalt transporter CorA [Radiobacillus kanasensis]|uniref:magnesium/cobalt transporter CorA n=1 Tax=Radiobacillus kanasensis TaxID=2844358 RepID=UPI001E2EE2C0|nr:magnesium/cobalt transporter CorA [Radiobacillus kanasensis]UFT98870.1 magnesium/cobalt transporter CorA [Radiobacillus kanasensis]